MENVEQFVGALYELRDIQANEGRKISILRSYADYALRVLDSISIAQRASSPEHPNYDFLAKYELLRGKLLDVIPQYVQEAEEHLLEAVKFSPFSPDALCSLANCLWKKGDLHPAKDIYNQALLKGPNKKILCDLSMVERTLAQDKELNTYFSMEKQRKLLCDSIEHAKEAIQQDPADGNSWYNLGNAYLTSFFLTGYWDCEKITLSAEAYQNADNDQRMKRNPVLCYNYATVSKYLENYEIALTKFEAAAMRDPSLNSSKEVETIINFLDLIDSVLKKLVRDNSLLSAAASGLDRVVLNSSLRKTIIDNLSEGRNKEVAVVGKVLFFASQEKSVSLYYILCDSKQNCFVVLLFGVLPGVIQRGDRLTLLRT